MFTIYKIVFTKLNKKITLMTIKWSSIEMQTLFIRTCSANHLRLQLKKCLQSNKSECSSIFKTSLREDDKKYPFGHLKKSYKN